MSREDLERLSKPELIELVLKLQRPAKTSHTSSKPPSTDRKTFVQPTGVVRRAHRAVVAIRCLARAGGPKGPKACIFGWPAYTQEFRRLHRS